MADDGSDINPHAQTTPDPVAAAEALKFFVWAYAEGDKMAEELDYVPMPKKVVADIEKAWASEITSDQIAGCRLDHRSLRAPDRRPSTKCKMATWLRLSGVGTYRRAYDAKAHRSQAH